MMFDRFVYRLFDALGWLLCELAFKTDCRGPFAWTYRAGCKLYGKATDVGIRCGDLVKNPACRPGSNEPLYVRRLP
jgi:hypothetical protein